MRTEYHELARMNTCTKHRQIHRRAFARDSLSCMRQHSAISMPSSGARRADWDSYQSRVNTLLIVRAPMNQKIYAFFTRSGQSSVTRFARRKAMSRAGAAARHDLREPPAHVPSALLARCAGDLDEAE